MQAPERVACCTICLCMAVAVFSSVALVYLTSKATPPKRLHLSRPFLFHEQKLVKRPDNTKSTNH